MPFPNVDRCGQAIVWKPQRQSCLPVCLARFEGVAARGLDGADPAQGLPHGDEAFAGPEPVDVYPEAKHSDGAQDAITVWHDGGETLLLPLVELGVHWPVGVNKPQFPYTRPLVGFELGATVVMDRASRQDFESWE